jgi:hypothetical protein
MEPHKADVIVLIESVYSMDGDTAPVRCHAGCGITSFGAQVSCGSRTAHLWKCRSKNDSKISCGVPSMYQGMAPHAEQVEQHPALPVRFTPCAADATGAVVCSTVFRDHLINYG